MHDFFNAAFSTPPNGKKYKECWTVDLNKDVIGDALESMGYHAPKSSTDFLAYRLRNIRAWIKYNSEWHFPTFEELKEGDIVQIQTSYGWSEGTWPEVLTHDTHVNLFGGNTLESQFKYANLRVSRIQKNIAYSSNA